MKVTVIHGYLLFTPPDDDLTPFLFSGGGGSVNTGKYKGENWGDDDESQQDIRWIVFVCVFLRLCLCETMKVNRAQSGHKFSQESQVH